MSQISDELISCYKKIGIEERLLLDLEKALPGSFPEQTAKKPIVDALMPNLFSVLDDSIKPVLGKELGGISGVIDHSLSADFHFKETPFSKDVIKSVKEDEREDFVKKVNESWKNLATIRFDKEDNIFYFCLKDYQEVAV